MLQVGKKLIAMMMVSILLASCGGRAAHPIMVRQEADETMSCDAYAEELKLIRNDIAILEPKTHKTNRNTGLMLAGFLVVPLLFLDFSKSEEIEVDAYRKRYTRLAVLASGHGCQFDADAVPEFKPEPILMFPPLSNGSGHMAGRR